MQLTYFVLLASDSWQKEVLPLHHRFISGYRYWTHEVRIVVWHGQWSVFSSCSALPLLLSNSKIIWSTQSTGTKYLQHLLLQQMGKLSFRPWSHLQFYCRVLLHSFIMWQNPHIISCYEVSVIVAGQSKLKSAQQFTAEGSKGPRRSYWGWLSFMLITLTAKSFLVVENKLLDRCWFFTFTSSVAMFCILDKLLKKPK